MKYLAILLAALCISANAGQLVAHFGPDWVLVTDDQCTSEAVTKLLPTNSGEWRAARGFVNGKLYEACWRVIGNGAGAHVIYEDGDQGQIPAQAFATQPEA